MTPDPTPHAVLDEIAGHAHGDDLSRLVHTAAFAAADERRTSLEDGLAELVDRAGLAPADAETRFGNAIRALERRSGEGAGSAPRALLAGLLARGVALSPPNGAAAEERVAEALVWLATYTPIDALTALDAAMDERAAGLWKAVSALVRRADEGALPQLGRAGALIGAAALHASTSPSARAEATALADEVRDPVARALLRDAVEHGKRVSRASGDLGRASRTSGDLGRASRASGDLGRVSRTSGAATQGEPGEEDDAADGEAGALDESGDAALGRASRAPTRIEIEGELVTPPRSPLPLLILAVTGILFVLQLGRLMGRFLLRYRRPAALEVSAHGVTLRAKTQLFGRTLREQETHIPIEALLRATREVRYPRLGLYAGLAALGLGTYVGISLLVDGARAGSPELLGTGALVLAMGVALDFGLSHLKAGRGGQCRVVIVPRKGPVVALGGVEQRAADAALGKLARA